MTETVHEDEPQLLAASDRLLASFAGMYETIATVIRATVDHGRLMATSKIKPEMAAVLGEMDDEPPVRLALIAGAGDLYVVPEGSGKGLRGYFARDSEGRVGRIHVGGRLHRRVTAVGDSGGC